MDAVRLMMAILSSVLTNTNDNPVAKVEPRRRGVKVATVVDYRRGPRCSCIERMSQVRSAVTYDETNWMDVQLSKARLPHRSGLLRKAPDRLSFRFAVTYIHRYSRLGH